MIRFAKLTSLAAAALLLSACVPENTRPNVFSPEPGVECFRDREVCYDYDGPSVRHTRIYFGDYAAESLLDWLESGGSGPDYRPPHQGNVFNPTIGIRCIRNERICYVDYGPSVPATDRWLGHNEARELVREIERGRHNQFVPEDHVRCSRRDRICTFRNQVSHSHTRQWLGVNTPTNPSGNNNVFYPANGIRCVRNDGVCYENYGPSVPATDRWLGDRQARNLVREIERGQYNQFIPENDVRCSRGSGSCSYRGRHSDSHTRRWLRTGNGRPPGNNVFHPATGIRCVRDEGICHENYGPSVPATERWLGDRQARDLVREIERGQFNQFIPEVEVRCSRSARVCTHRGRQSASHSRRWLNVGTGRPPGPAAPETKPNEYFPESGIRCVRSEEVCYRGRQPDLAATRKYFGREAGNRLEGSNRPTRPQPKPEPELDLSGRLTVNVTFGRERPDRGVLHVRLVAGNPSGVRNQVVARSTVNLNRGSGTEEVTLTYSPGEIVAQFPYRVEAWVEQGNKRVSESTEDNRVLTHGAPDSRIQVTVSPR